MSTDFLMDGFSTWANLLVTKRSAFGAAPRELLDSPDRLRLWLRQSGLEPVRAPTEEDLARAITLREALRSVALAHTDHTPPPRKAVATIATFTRSDAPPRPVVRAGRLVRERPADTSAALARIARAAVDQMTGAEGRYLRQCAERDCRWVFLDPTGRQRWCSTGCASRGRVRAHRERKRLNA
ncbi:MAG: CGNR zinc finger domain-containing protein [Solirubrobacteraceae bacterium]